MQWNVRQRKQRGGIVSKQVITKAQLDDILRRLEEIGRRLSAIDNRLNMVEYKADQSYSQTMRIGPCHS